MLESHIQQAAIFEINVRAPGLVIFSTLGGGYRNPREAAKLKREGARPGIPDLVIPYARKGYHGLYIEVKRPGGVLSKQQKSFMRFLNDNGYLAIMLADATEIVNCVLDYVGENYIKHFFY